MTQTISIRLDQEARKGLTEVCKELGLSVSTAFNIFAKRVARDKKIPFDLAVDPIYEEGVVAFNNLRKEAKEKGVQGLSLNTINKIINDTRKLKK